MVDMNVEGGSELFKPIQQISTAALREAYGFGFIEDRINVCN
jgi:hypothetical protein